MRLNGAGTDTQDAADLPACHALPNEPGHLRLPRGKLSHAMVPMWYGA